MDTLIYAQSEYNFLFSSIHLEDLIKKCKDAGYKCVALCDPNLYSAYKFISLAKKNNIKPILGLEFNIINNDFTSKIIALAKNINGYKELLNINNNIKIKNYSYKLEDLSKYNNLIFISRFKDSELLYNFKKSNDLFLNVYNEYSSFLSNFYVGISKEEYSLEIDSINLYNLCKKNNIKVLPLHQSLYLDKKDYIVHEALTKIGSKEALKGNYFLPTREELDTEFEGLDFSFELKTLDNMVETFDIKVKSSLPHFDNNLGISSRDYLKSLCLKGLARRLSVSASKDAKDYEKRLTKELDIISKMGYDDYFLIVWDYVRFAKKNNVMVGPGRGSACGSLVAYTLGITNVDPLKYDLLFERFLNPSRVTMPDIDMDFPDDKRAFVINYVKEKYGINRVCTISAFDTFQIKSSLRDLGKALNIPSNKLNIIISEASSTKDYNALIEKYSDKTDICNLLYVAKKIENLPRHISTHAAGIIISSEDLDTLIPLQNGINSIYQSCFDAHDLADIGLLKMDFLGIKNLQIIDNCCKEIKTLNNINIQYIPLNDEATYKLLQKGDTMAVFQLESSGMRNVLKKLKPSKFEDIVAVLALYRPGPMDQIDTYIERKNGIPFEYIHPDLEPILKSTYGIIVYQEQIMLIASSFAKMSLAEADLLRRAVSKKDEKIIEAQREPFVSACEKNGYSREIGTRLYNDIAKFAEYGFNKSHAVGYALLSYQMAYLKANYFLIFMEELLNTVVGNLSDVRKYIEYGTLRGIKIYNPNINISTDRFIKYRDGLILPLESVKGVGTSLTNDILEERGAKGDFTSFSDFISRIKVSEANAKMLIYSGCFDALSKSKKELIDFLENGKGSYELHLSDMLDRGAEEFDDITLKTNEAEALGFNIKYNNFNNINLLMRKYKTSLISMKNLNQNINVLVEFREIKEIKTKKGDYMAVGTLFDSRAEISFVLFPKVYEIFKTILNVGSLYIASGEVEYDSKYLKYQMKINSLKLCK